MLDGLLGDVDNNGHVDLADGLLVAMHRVDPSLWLPNHGQIALGDVNGNGQIDRTDAALLATFVTHPSASAVSSLRIGQQGGYSLDPVTEMVWGSILGTDPQDATVARLLDEVPVLLSGVFEVDGRDYLYLGIGRDYYEEHGAKHIYDTLKRRFPLTPILIEASDGVQRQNATRTTVVVPGDELPEEETVIFSDTFQDGLDAWTPLAAFSTSPGWDARPFDETDNLVAQTWECPWVCGLTTETSFNLAGYESVTLSFDRWVDERVTGNEGLAVFIGNNGTYTLLDRWDSEKADSEWHRETYTIEAEDLSDEFTIRFSANPSDTYLTNFDNAKRIAVDNVQLTAKSIFYSLNLSIPAISVTPTEVQSGTNTTIHFTVQNDGNATAASQTIRIYRHRSPTNTPLLFLRIKCWLPRPPV